MAEGAKLQRCCSQCHVALSEKQSGDKCPHCTQLYPNLSYRIALCFFLLMAEFSGRESGRLLCKSLVQAFVAARHRHVKLKNQERARLETILDQVFQKKFSLQKTLLLGFDVVCPMASAAIFPSFPAVGCPVAGSNPILSALPVSSLKNSNRGFGCE